MGDLPPGATTGLIDKLVSKNISIEAGHGGTLPWDFLEKEGKLTGTIAKNDHPMGKIDEHCSFLAGKIWCVTKSGVSNRDLTHGNGYEWG